MKPSVALQLKDAYKTFTLDQDKVCLPEETVRQFKDRLAKLNLDILKETVRIDNGRLDIPVYFSVCGRDAYAIIGNKKQMGKGATPHQAEASAVMELAERFSFFSFYKNRENFITDTYANLKERAMAFESIARSVHDDSADLAISRRFFEELPLRWTPAHNLTRHSQAWIPFDWFYTINEFNGPSAGNCVEEALVQGICEIVERHVSSLISQGRQCVPLIDPASAQDPILQQLLDKYQKAGIKLYLSDFSLDVGIPTVGALAYDPTTFPEKSEIVWTAGTTPSPEKAFSRALTEVAQLAGDFNSNANYVASGLPKLKRLDEADFIINSPEWRRVSQLPDLSADNLKTEVENCVAALAAQGMEVWTIPITHPKLGVPAFYTLIPGAHFRERAIGTSVAMFVAKTTAATLPPADAIERLLQMDAALPGKYYLHFYLGSCHLDLNRPQAALGHFQQALKMDPNHQDLPSIYSYTGVALKELQQYEKALKALEKGLALDDERTDIHNLMGFCWFKLKEHKKAIACFEQVLRLNPDSAIDYANIASNYRELGDIQKAIHYYETALEIDPTIDFALQNLLKLQSAQPS